MTGLADTQDEHSLHLIASYRTITPRLASWAMRVMPLIAAVEDLQKAQANRMGAIARHRVYDEDTIQDTVKATHLCERAKEQLVCAALALNLTLPEVECDEQVGA